MTPTTMTMTVTTTTTTTTTTAKTKTVTTTTATATAKTMMMMKMMREMRRNESAKSCQKLKFAASWVSSGLISLHLIPFIIFLNCFLKWVVGRWRKNKTYKKTYN